MTVSAGHQEKAAVRFRFGLFEADSGSGELRKSGVRLRLQAQPFRVLLCLLERPGELVTREEIQNRLWGSETIVDFDHSLGTAINKLRDTLGDSAENPRFIETLARRGYRFLAPVTVLNPPEEGIKPPAADPLERPTRAADPLPASQSGGTTIPLHPVRRGRSRTLLWILCAAAAAGLGGFVLGVGQRPVYTAPPRLTRITFSGRVSPGDPLFESFPGTATDGSRIYFQEIENGGAVLAQALIADGETTTLALPEELASPSLGDISPDGSQLLLRNHLATAPEQALWIASTIGGTAQKIPGILAHDATWLPDGQHILYASGDSLYVANENGSGIHRFATLPGRAFWLRWSPDGSRLRLTLLNDETHTSALWNLNRHGGDAHLLLPDWTSSPPAECCGSWTADGRYYVFQSARNGDSNIWAIPERGGWLGRPEKPIRITNGPLDYEAPITGREGDRTFFIGLTNQSELLRYDPDAHLFVPCGGPLSNARRVAFSRDGQWVAWIRDDDGSLWRSRTNGSGRMQITSRPMQVFMMHWSPDAQHLVLMARQPGMPWKIYTVDADGGHLQEVLDEKRSEADPDWSPDQKTLVFGRLPDLMAEASEPKAIYLVNVATRKLTRLPGSSGLFSPRWSASGKYIAALSIDQKKLMVYDVAKKTWRLLAQQNIADPAWSHDDHAIYFHDFAQADQPIYRAVVATGKVERVADLHDLRSAIVLDYRFAGLAPGDVLLVSARTSTANLYSAELPR